MTTPQADYGHGLVNRDAIPPAPYNGPLEVDTTALVEWNPLATTAPQRIPLKVSGGRATVDYRPWSGRERLAFEDAIGVRFLTKDEEGEGSVLIGSMRAYGVALTVVGSSGFPPLDERDRPFLTGTVDQRLADLLALDAETYDEIRSTALRIQPLPRLDADDATPAAGSDDEDPSPTPRTRPAAVRDPDGLDSLDE